MNLSVIWHVVLLLLPDVLFSMLRIIWSFALVLVKLQSLVSLQQSSHQLVDSEVLSRVDTVLCQFHRPLLFVKRLCAGRIAGRRHDGLSIRVWWSSSGARGRRSCAYVYKHDPVGRLLRHVHGLLDHRLADERPCHRVLAPVSWAAAEQSRKVGVLNVRSLGNKSAGHCARHHRWPRDRLVRRCWKLEFTTPPSHRASSPPHCQHVTLSNVLDHEPLQPV